MKNVKDFVSIDFETLQAVATDGRMYNHLPIQIGAVKYIDGKPTGERIDTYIKPPVEGVWESYWTIGIDSVMCEGEPSFDQVLPQLIDLVGDLPLVAFNSSSERYAVKDACDFYDLAYPFAKDRFIDPFNETLKQYKNPVPKMYEGHSGLARWAEYFGVLRLEWEEHNAVDDAEMAAELYLHIQDMDLDALLQKKENNAGWFARKSEQKDMSLYGEPIPEEEVVHPENPLNRKYVCLTGFEREVENILNRKLLFLGAGRLDNPKACMHILIPSPSSMQKYGNPPKGKILDALKKGKQIMSVEELKEILIMYDLYEGEI